MEVDRACSHYCQQYPHQVDSWRHLPGILAEQVDQQWREYKEQHIADLKYTKTKIFTSQIMVTNWVC